MEEESNPEEFEHEVISKRFWLYDIEYDNNPMLEGNVCSYWNRFCYFVLISYTIIYAILWQKNNTITNSVLIINYAIYISIALMSSFMVWLMIRFEKYNKILLKPRENEIESEESVPEKENEKILDSKADEIHHNAIAVRVVGQSGEYSIHTKLWALICLATIFGHATILIVMIIRFPFYGTSWIVFGINMFNMITCHIFTTLLGANIIYNLLADICFYQECVDNGQLEIIMMRLYAETGFNSNIQMGISIVWGSMASAFIVGDTLSIVLVILFVIGFALYWLQAIYQKNIN